MENSKVKPDIHLVMDTSAWESNAFGNSARFQALNKLATHGAVMVHIPPVVEGEVRAHIQKRYTENSGLLKKPLKALQKGVKFVDSNDVDCIARFVEFLAEKAPNLALAEFEERIGAMQCKRVPLDATQAQRTLDAYFAGEKPFSKVQDKENLPDSLILESIRYLATQFPTIHIVVEDKNLRDACSEIENVQVYNKLEGFLANPECANKLRETSQRLNIDLALELLKADIIVLPHIDCYDWAERELPNTTVYDGDIPSDDNEGSVVRVHSCEDPVWQFERSNYLGDGIFTIPVSLHIEAEISYYVFKSELDLLPYERKKNMAVSESSEHFYEVTEVATIRAEATGLLEVPLADLAAGDLEDTQLSEILRDGEIQIDSEPDLFVEQLSGVNP